MRKEALFAILGGIILGLAVAFGVWRTNDALTKIKNEQALPQKESEIQQSFSKANGNPSLNNPETKLTIAKPDHLDVYTQEKANIKGLTIPNSIVVISNNKNDYILKSNTEGIFSQEIELEDNTNNILIGIPNNNIKNITIFYSSELTKQLNQNQHTATQSAEQKAQERLREAELNIKAFIGTVTDKSDIYLQMRISDGTIQVIAIDEQTTAVNEKTKKGLSISDVAIGDYVVVLGQNLENKQIKALRVVISSPQEPENNTKFIKAVVTQTLKNSLLIKIDDNKEIELIPNKSVKIKTEVKDSNNRKQIKLADIKPEDILVAIGEERQDQFEARTILKLAR